MKPTLSEFIESSSIPPALIRAVVRQLGGWESFKESAHDIANYGISGGFRGFIYHSDTVKFARKNREYILDVCKDMARDFGESGPIALITGFTCLKGYTQDEIADGLYNPRSDNTTTVYNALAWFAGEEVARSFTDLED